MWIKEQLLSKAYDHIFGAKCFLCKKIGSELCEICVQKLPRSIETPQGFIYSHFSFRDEKVRHIIRKIKYYNRRSLLGTLCSKLKTRELSNFLGQDKYVLIPIPMPKLRVWLRGGNHSYFIAKNLSNILSFNIETNLLIRKKSTPQQAKTNNLSSREKNITGAFKINKILSLDAKILLIDDVTTTGATLLEAKRTLEKSGYSNIKAITLAH